MGENERLSLDSHQKTARAIDIKIEVLMANDISFHRTFIFGVASNWPAREHVPKTKVGNTAEYI